jgi:hypothetical protein
LTALLLDSIVFLLDGLLKPTEENWWGKSIKS